MLASTSSASQISGEWNNTKIYLRFTGQDHNATTDYSATIGDFTTNGLRSDRRTADLLTRMDNIRVYKRAITETKIATLFAGGALSINKLFKETFKAYPKMFYPFPIILFLL